MFRDPDAPPLPPPRPKQKGENAGQDNLLLDYELLVVIFDGILDLGFFNQDSTDQRVERIFFG